MNGWTYLPEFVRDGDKIKRIGPPMYRHESGACIDVTKTSCLAADMLDVEGKHNEAAETRRICSGDAQAFINAINRRQAEFDAGVP